jgi:hypothetical protein
VIEAVVVALGVVLIGCGIGGTPGVAKRFRYRGVGAIGKLLAEVGLVIVVPLGLVGVAGDGAASVPANNSTITSANQPIVSAWWASHGDLMAKLNDDALSLEVFFSEKHPSPRQEFAACKLLTKETGSPETIISKEINAVSQDPESTQSFWLSLYATVAYFDGAGNLCAIHSTSKSVRADAKSRTELKLGILRFGEVLNALRASGVQVGSEVSSTVTTTIQP